MVVGRIPTPAAYIFRPAGGNRLTRLAAVLRPGGEVVHLSCLAFVLRHPTVGTILIDTGYHPDASRRLRQDFGTRMGLLFRNLRPAEEPYLQQLGRLRVDPDAVERVVMTHLHVDHTSGMRLLPNARFLCARDEWQAATRDGAAGRGYAAKHLPPETRVELVDFETAGEPYGPFSRTIDLLGDGSIRLVSTPGHTPGHLSVLVQVEGARQVLVVGDALYTLRSMEEEILPLLTVGDELYLRSLREIKRFAEREPDAILIPSHDPTAWKALEARALAGD
jgi:N-acyl homoserine lactone hydrolase